MDAIWRKYTTRTGMKQLLRRAFKPFVKWFFGGLVKFQVTGLEFIPEEGPFIIAANHRSHADTGAIIRALLLKKTELVDRLMVLAARDHFFRFRPVGWFWNAVVNAFPFERKRKRDMPKSLAHALKLLEEKHSILIYPEGGRKPKNDNQLLQPFKPGVGKIALLSNVPVIPCALQGTEGFFPKSPFSLLLLPFRTAIFCLKGKAVKVSFGDSILPTDFRKPENLTGSLEKEVRALLIPL